MKASRIAIIAAATALAVAAIPSAHARVVARIAIAGPPPACGARVPVVRVERRACWRWRGAHRVRVAEYWTRHPGCVRARARRVRIAPAWRRHGRVWVG
jgi:hypothetical protein